MSMIKRLSLGLLAGLLIVLVKIIGPDQEYISSIIEASSSEKIFSYAFISLATVTLGAISVIFTKEKDPRKLLFFCASVPAMLSTYTGEVRDKLPIDSQGASIVNQSINRAAINDNFQPSIFSSTAFAQTAGANQDNECVEPSFFSKFSQSTQQYLTGQKYANKPYYNVIVASTKNYEEAKGIALQIFEKNKSWTPYVGCRRPDNPYYPVVIGPSNTQVEAAAWKGKFEQSKIMPETPYLSFYQYRQPIFTPQ